ncbi:MAG: hypothetical protein A2Y73_08555 [Chloroflexi bacterium RBG_13_56_8]|nr:MAG: hypothetical protein A2Y73_08555 [Chloroflexi bacterium RBG_13_56_8]
MKGQRLQITVFILVFGALSLASVLLWRAGMWGTFADPEALKELLGPWSPLVIVVAEILQVLLAPMPGQIIGIAAGYLYGVFWGTILSMIGLTLGTMIAIWLARRLGRPLLERIASPELLTRIDSYAQRRGSLTFFLIFLFPFLPDDVCCFLAGLTPLRMGELVLLAIVGRAPGIIVSTLIGARAQDLTWIQLALISGVGVILAVLFARNQEKLEGVMFRFLDRITRNVQKDSDEVR